MRGSIARAIQHSKYSAGERGTVCTSPLSFVLGRCWVTAAAPSTPLSGKEEHQNNDRYRTEGRAARSLFSCCFDRGLGVRVFAVQLVVWGVPGRYGRAVKLFTASRHDRVLPPQSTGILCSTVQRYFCGGRAG